MATYTDGFKKQISLLISNGNKKICEINKEYDIDPNTLRAWVKKYQNPTKMERFKPIERWKSHSEMLKILKCELKNKSLTINKVIYFHNKLTKACGGHDFLCKETTQKEKADQFIKLYPELYKFYEESSLLKKLSEEDKGLNYVESPDVYTQIILQYVTRFNLEPYIFKVSNLFFNCASKINLFMKNTQKDGLSLLENHRNLNSDELEELIFQRIKNRTKLKKDTNGRSILDTTNEISNFERLFILKYEKYPEDIEIQNLLECNYFTIRVEILLRFYFQYYKLLFLINLKRQEDSLEFNLTKYKDNFEDIDDIILKLKSINKNTVSNIVKKILSNEDCKKVISETRKVQRFVKDTFEKFKTKFPGIVKMFKNDNDLLKAYIFLYIYKDKKPKDKTQKENLSEDLYFIQEIEYTKYRYDKILKKYLLDNKINPEERKYIMNDFNSISYYFFDKELHKAIIKIEKNANLTFFRLFNDDLIFKETINRGLSPDLINGLRHLCNN